MSITLYYLSPVSEGSEPSLPSEMDFTSTKTMRQFIRRKSIERYSVHIDGKLCYLIGNEYIPVCRLSMFIAYAIMDDEKCNPF